MKPLLSSTGAKCKVKWDLVCRPKAYGGFGVLNTYKFARALRLRWPWHEWTTPDKLWVGMDNPCNDEDMKFFYASTYIVLGDGAKAPFSRSPWLPGRKPKDIAPLIYEASMRKNWKVREALKDDAWVVRIKSNVQVSVQHIRQFMELSTLLSEFHLDELAEDEIIWKHTNNGH